MRRRDVLRYLLAAACGAAIMGIVGYVALLWYFRDVFR